MSGLLKKQLTFLLYGFVFWLPLILVIYIGILLFGNAEKVGRMILGVAVPEKYLYTGLGFVLCILETKWSYSERNNILTISRQYFNIS